METDVVFGGTWRLERGMLPARHLVLPEITCSVSSTLASHQELSCWDGVRNPILALEAKRRTFICVLTCKNYTQIDLWKAGGDARQFSDEYKNSMCKWVMERTTMQGQSVAMETVIGSHYVLRSNNVNWSGGGTWRPGRSWVSSVGRFRSLFPWCKSERRSCHWPPMAPLHHKESRLIKKMGIISASSQNEISKSVSFNYTSVVPPLTPVETRKKSPYGVNKVESEKRSKGRTATISSMSRARAVDGVCGCGGPPIWLLIMFLLLTRDSANTFSFPYSGF